jgi:hypothetical protein
MVSIVRGLTSTLPNSDIHLRLSNNCFLISDWREIRQSRV